jgi:hypothetical protein
VTFESDLVVLRPADPAAGNRGLLYSVANRGSVPIARTTKRRIHAAARELVAERFLLHEDVALVAGGALRSYDESVSGR